MSILRSFLKNPFKKEEKQNIENKNVTNVIDFKDASRKIEQQRNLKLQENFIESVQKLTLKEVLNVINNGVNTENITDETLEKALSIGGENTLQKMSEQSEQNNVPKLRVITKNREINTNFKQPEDTATADMFEQVV